MENKWITIHLHRVKLTHVSTVENLSGDYVHLLLGQLLTQ